MQTIGQLETKLVNVEQELSEVERLRRQQIAELNMVRQEEREKYERNAILQLESLNDKCEHEKKLLAQQLKRQKTQASDEAADLKHKYELKLKQAADEHEQLEHTLEQLQRDKKAGLDQSKKEITQLTQQLEHERAASNKYHLTSMKVGWDTKVTFTCFVNKKIILTI